MRKKREFIEGAFYHVTSRTNDKVKVFGSKLGRKIMLMVLQEAKEKFCFRLSNFCVMPNHIHLLIKPAERTKLCMIMHWIKTRSAKWWNNVHGSKNHLWGDRYFARVIDDPEDYEKVMRYIDHNPVTAGLCENPAEWKASGAYYKTQDLPGLVDYYITERLNYVKLLSPIPPEVAKLLPPKQLEHTLRFYGVFAEAVERLYTAIPDIPNIGETENVDDPKTYLHYFTGTADYQIFEYDGNDTMYGKVSFSVYPAEPEYRKFSLSNLKSNQYLQLELRQVLVPGTFLENGAWHSQGRKAYLAVVKRFKVFKGRAGRKEFWMFFLYNLIICVAFGILSSVPVIGFLFGILSFPLSIAIFVISLAVSVRRLHDTNRSGLMWLLVLIPLVGLIIVIVFWAQKGSSGANKYGSKPMAGGTRRVSPKTASTRKSSSKKQSKKGKSK